MSVKNLGNPSYNGDIYCNNINGTPTTGYILLGYGTVKMQFLFCSYTPAAGGVPETYTLMQWKNGGAATGNIATPVLDVPYTLLKGKSGNGVVQLYVPEMIMNAPGNNNDVRFPSANTYRLIAQIVDTNVNPYFLNGQTQFNFSSGSVSAINSEYESLTFPSDCSFINRTIGTNIVISIPAGAAGLAPAITAIDATKHSFLVAQATSSFIVYGAPAVFNYRLGWTPGSDDASTTPVQQIRTTGYNGSYRQADI